MMTNWANRAVTDMPPIDPDYMPSVGRVTQMLEKHRAAPAGRAAGCPVFARSRPIIS